MTGSAKPEQFNIAGAGSIGQRTTESQLAASTASQRNSYLRSPDLRVATMRSDSVLGQVPSQGVRTGALQMMLSR